MEIKPERRVAGISVDGLHFVGGGGGKRDAAGAELDVVAAVGDPETESAVVGIWGGPESVERPGDAGWGGV